MPSIKPESNQSSAEFQEVLSHNLSVIDDHLRFIAARTREAWRLSELSNNPKPLLPSHLQPSLSLALSDLSILVAEDKSLAKEAGMDYPSAFRDWAQMLEKEIGPITDWVPADATFPGERTWLGLSEKITASFGLAREALAKKEVLISDIWEESGRANVAMSFGLRAVGLLHPLKQSGEIPAGCYAQKISLQNENFLAVQIKDATNDCVIASSHSLGEAVDEALDTILRNKAPYQMTGNEFIKATTQVGVVVGRGKTGEAKTGKARLLYENMDEQTRLLSLLRKATRRSILRGEVDGGEHFTQEQIDQKAKESASILMQDSFTGHYSSFMGKGIGHIVLTRAGAVPPSTLRQMHLQYVEEAITEGHEVPDHVLLDVGLLKEQGADTPKARRPAP